MQCNLYRQYNALDITGKFRYYTLVVMCTCKVYICHLSLVLENKLLIYLTALAWGGIRGLRARVWRDPFKENRRTFLRNWEGGSWIYGTG